MVSIIEKPAVDTAYHDLSKYIKNNYYKKDIGRDVIHSMVERKLKKLGVGSKNNISILYNELIVFLQYEVIK